MTRTLPGAHKSAAHFAELGLTCAISPLLKVMPAPVMPPQPAKDDVLVFTSQNGLSWFCEFTKRRDWRVVTVGDETAAKAKSAGFTSVISAGGTSEDVTQIIKSNFPKGTSIVHCAGKHVRGTITQDLCAAGYTARRDLYYQSSPISQLPNIDLSKLTYIALYSPLAAQTLAGFRPNLAGVTLLSISPATDAALDIIGYDLRCQSRRIARAPNETAMLALLRPSGAV